MYYLFLYAKPFHLQNFIDVFSFQHSGKINKKSQLVKKHERVSLFINHYYYYFYYYYFFYLG